MLITLFSLIRESLRRGAVSRLALALLGLTAVAQAKPVAFDIPAQSAADALIVFSKQSKADVLYSFKDLSVARSRAVVGEFEPAAAIALLLKDTGFVATLDDGKFVVVREKLKPGSISGSLVLANSGAAATGVTVTLRETGATAVTGRTGGYVFTEVPAGAYTLLAAVEGFSRLKITDVVVKAGMDTTLSVQSMPLIKRDGVVQLMEEYVVSAKNTELMDKFEVTDARPKPFSDANVDVPRTINDVQPYYIFDSKTIDQSGATNVEDFLKQRLTMNTTALTNGQRGVNNVGGNTSSINLRGVGPDKTLILVNGRRLAGVSYRGTDAQPDLNGIPLSAIDRVEVMPSSAAGIYGGSALGGVVNVILKKNYVGGELRTVYDNSFDSDAVRRTVSLSYGLSLEGGRTHVMINGSWSDSQELLVQDRQGLIESARATIQRNAPTFFATAANPILGALPNIGPASATQTTLTLKNGTVLPSNRTYISAGTTANISRADLYAMLIANAGTWNYELPATAQDGGKLLPFDATPKVESFSASIRRQMLPKLDFFADFSLNKNETRQNYSPTGTGATVPIASSASPFTTDVTVTYPAKISVPYSSSSTNRTLTLGAIAQLPWGWTGEFDYTWTKNRFKTVIDSLDAAATFADRNSGALNLFIDTYQFLDLSKYVITSPYEGDTDLDDFALRASGPLFHLPWGVPTLTFGAEHRIGKVPAATFITNNPVTVAASFLFTYYERDSTTDSGYSEITLPLIKKDWLPLVHVFDLQAAGRREVYTADTGTTFIRSAFNVTPPTLTYGGVTRNGGPYFSQVTYASNDYTVGLKYQPIPELTFRGSRGTAFLPPTPVQLSPSNNPSTTTTNVTDPTTGLINAVTTVGGGNSGLTPQHSKSTNGGIIWEPSWKPLRGLRLNAEYYKIEQFDAISALTAAQIVGSGNVYADRITRDPVTGRITQVNISNLNLYHVTTEGWDLSANYTLRSSVGTFNVGAVASIIEHLKTQFSPTQPEYEAAGYNPAENGAPKHKSNITLNWEGRHWTAGWAARTINSYKVHGAVGGPNSRQNANGGVFSNYIAAQGSDTVSSQIYHDLYAGYAFGRPTGTRSLREKLIDGLTVQLGVRNVFDKTPPLDVNGNGNATYYLSPYGDLRLRSYWLSVRKAF